MKNKKRYKYLRWQRMRMRAAEKRRKRKKRLQKQGNNIHTNFNGSKQKPIDFTIYAPVDFRVIENTAECLDFFRRLRQESSIRIG